MSMIDEEIVIAALYTDFFDLDILLILPHLGLATAHKQQMCIYWECLLLT